MCRLNAPRFCSCPVRFLALAGALADLVLNVPIIVGVQTALNPLERALRVQRYVGLWRSQRAIRQASMVS